MSPFTGLASSQDGPCLLLTLPEWQHHAQAISQLPGENGAQGLSLLLTPQVRWEGTRGDSDRSISAAVALSSSCLSAWQIFCTWLQPGNLGQTPKEGILHGELLSHLSACGCPHEGGEGAGACTAKAALKVTSSTPVPCHHVDINQASGCF